MSIFRLLHLSDLHFDSDGLEDISMPLKALLEDLSRLMDQGLSPDAIVFSGDLIRIGDHGYSEDFNEYEMAKTEFINPLLDHLENTTDQFFICPGNHDIERGKIREIVEAGSEAQLIDRDAVNRLVDRIDQNPEVFERMGNYERFLGDLPNSNLVSRNSLYSTYRLNIEDKTIGIACINSAWRAFGGKDDYGHLIIGERTIDKCINDLSDCDLRIAVTHHPHDYLEEFERSRIKKLIYGGFSFWLTGHMHDPDIDLVQTFSNSRVVVIRGGSLYEHRDHYNGYSLVEYSFDSSSGRVFLREYIDRSRSFVPALAYEAEDGIFGYELAAGSVEPIKGDLALFARLRDQASAEANMNLIPTLLGATEAPREIDEIFVEPPLARRSEYKRRSDDMYVDLSELTASDRNVVFIGSKESGKTTLLTYIRTAYLDPENIDRGKLPILIDFTDLPRGKVGIKNAIRNYFAKYELESDVDEVLSSQDWILLVDNLDPTNKSGIASLIDFISEHPEGQYMFTVSQNLLLDLGFDELPDLGIDLDRIYIHKFGRKQIRVLAEKWYQDSSTDIVLELADLIHQQLHDLNLPPTPLIVSLIMLITEQDRDYAVTNKASLLEDIIEMLFAKPLQQELQPGGIDYRNIEDLLAHLAEHLAERHERKLSVDACGEAINQYFSMRGLPLRGGTSQLLSFLTQRGVLIEADGYVSFGFDAFLEFFIAKRMIDDEAFKEKILDESNYIDFANSIDYMTGLERTNRDVIVLLRERLEASMASLIPSLGLTDLTAEKMDEIQLNSSIIDTIPKREKDQLIERIRSARLTEEVKDAIHEAVYAAELTDGEDEVETESEDEDEELDVLDSQSQAANILALYSLVVRNCELIDDKDFKKENLRFSIETSLKVLYLMMLTMESFVEQLDEDDLGEYITKLEDDWDLDLSEFEIGSEDLLDAVVWWMKLVPALLIQTMIGHWLGTPKLSIILEEEIDNGDLPIYLKLPYVMLYSDLRSPRYVDKIEGLVGDIIENRFYRELLYMRVLHIYAARIISPREQRRLESILANLLAKEEGVKPKDKAKLIGRVRKDLSRQAESAKKQQE